MLFSYRKAITIRNFAFVAPPSLSGPFLVAWGWLRPQTACAAPLAKAGQGLNGNGGGTDGGRGRSRSGPHLMRGRPRRAHGRPIMEQGDQTGEVPFRFLGAAGRPITLVITSNGSRRPGARGRGSHWPLPATTTMLANPTRHRNRQDSPCQLVAGAALSIPRCAGRVFAAKVAPRSDRVGSRSCHQSGAGDCYMIARLNRWFVRKPLSI
jgi:hypothetical protein